MATVYADTADGYVGYGGSASWATTRDAGTGNAASSTSHLLATGVSAYFARGRYQIYRSFFSFDTSGISNTVSSATFKVYGATNTGADIIAVQATSDISTLSTADYQSIEGWSTGDNESNVTKYSSEITSWSTSGYNDITLNSTARGHMTSNSTLYLCLLEYDHDLKDSAPSNGDPKSGLYYFNTSYSGRRPYIDYTEETPVTTDNAIFFGTNF
jgi:hypothetical protein